MIFRLVLCAAAWPVLLASPNAKAAEEKFSVDLQAERQNVKVADPVWITLAATAPEGWEIELPDIPDAFEQLNVVERVDRLQESDHGSITVMTRFKLESLLPGDFQVGPLEVQFVPKDLFDDGEPGPSTETIQRSTEPLMMHVRSARGFFERRRLRDIYGTVSVPWTWRQWTIAAMVMALGLAVSWVVHRSVGRWFRSQRISQRKLLEQLDQLDEARLNRSLSNDQLIVSVAAVVRQSLQLAEGLRPVYRTTDEWVAHLKKTHLSEAVELVLREADAIKFSGKPATLDQTRRSLAAARTSVQTLLRDEPGAVRPRFVNIFARAGSLFRGVLPRTRRGRGLGGGA